ncbi:MAG: hypothetical protein JWR37_735, partial [Mycobacterium sp.]|nr:hypothetical protein [Mycobacterium sp.]
MSDPAGSKLKQVGAILLVVLPLFVPEVIIELTPLRHDAGLLIAGMLPAIIAWTYTPRLAVASIPLSALMNGLAVLVFGHPAATTVFALVIAIL